MKAMILRAPGDVALGSVEAPKPERDQVLVRMTHSGICGTDRKIFDGAIPVRHPLIMGHEMAGEIVEGAGDGARHGDRVVVDPCLYCGACFYCRAGLTNLCPQGGLIGRDADGGFAEYMIAPRSHVFPLPDAIDSRNAPLIQVVTTCVHSQRQMNIMAGQSVVVVGLGVTGQVHVQLSKARGAHPVIGISRSAWKRRMAEQLGADLTLAGGDEGVRSVIEATEGRGADVVIESTGYMSSVADAISMCRMGATLLLFGIITGGQGALPFYQIYFKELTIVNGRAAKGEDFPASIDLIARGAIRLDPLVTHVVPIAELGTAMEMLTSDADQRMKIILENRL
jgi:2-desacetyl-2-hydroxyethyl bacteriochlorophyllide A dehydrogenase